MLTKRSIAVGSLLMLSACGGQDVNVQWTVEGKPAADGCSPLGDAVHVMGTTRDSREGETRDVDATFPCTDGSGLVPLGSFANIELELMRDGAVVGTSGPQALTVGSNALAEPPTFEADIEVHTGILSVELEVADQSCADAGASSFSVDLLIQRSGVDTGVVEEDVSVSCEGGKALYRSGAVHVGNTYIVQASTSAGGVDYVGDIAVSVQTPLVGTVLNLVKAPELAE